MDMQYFVSRVSFKNKTKKRLFFKKKKKTYTLLLVLYTLDFLQCNCHRLDLIIPYLYSQKGTHFGLFP